ncbi:hypothetical protein MIR68_010399 [Amoeboaphelidium protococcarum]|nr:hypothetical protein MIR68_010399 [Amoeboaphelidium protococcarum]
MQGLSGSSKFSVQWLPPIFCYCLASISMTLTNKLVLSSFQFKMPFLMLSVQSITTLCLLELSVLIQLVKSHRPLNNVDVRRWFPISVLMGVMLFTGSKSLQFLSVPIFTIFKNLSIILVAFGEVKLFGGKVSPLMLCSFLLMVISSIVAAHSDFSAFNSNKDMTSEDSRQLIAGYMWMLINCFSSASFVLFMRYSMKYGSNYQMEGTKPNAPGSPFKDFDTVFYNNMLTAPLFLVMSLLGADGDLGAFFDYYFPQSQTDFNNDRAVERYHLLYALVFSGFSAYWISWASAWCIRATNSTTYSMVGALNKLPIALFGLLFFPDANKNEFTRGLSIFLGFMSGVLYTYAKIQQDKQSKEHQ